MLTQYRCFILHRHPVSLILMYDPLGYRPIKQRRKENVGENGIRLTAGCRGIGNNILWDVMVIQKIKFTYNRVR